VTDEVDDCRLRPSRGCQASSQVVPAGLEGSSIAKVTLDDLRSDRSMLSAVIALAFEPSTVLESSVKNPFFVVVDGAVSGETSDPGLWAFCPVMGEDSLIDSMIDRRSVSRVRGKQVPAGENCFQKQVSDKGKRCEQTKSGRKKPAIAHNKYFKKGCLKG
jgi:hypothetical protein